MPVCEIILRRRHALNELCAHVNLIFSGLFDFLRFKLGRNCLQELEQDEMLAVVRQHYEQYDTAGMNTMYNWGSGHLHEAAINQEKARLRQSAIMLQATASSLQVQQIPPNLSR